MKKKHKKLTKRKKKFFIFASCYVAVFLVTFFITISTLSWFSGSTWATEELYMGGPVYIDFGDGEGNELTPSGEGSLILNLPPTWNKLYPGMNIHFQSTCIVQGAKFEKTKTYGETVTYYTTGAILRAKAMMKIYAPDGSVYPGEIADQETLDITKALYNNLWPQLKIRATSTSDAVGSWVFDEGQVDQVDENYFYYVLKNQNHDHISDYLLAEVGGTEEDAIIDFLNNAVITLSGLGFRNEHADCRIEFIFVFQALQAFLPYEQKDLNTDYLGDMTDRTENKVIYSDLGTPKPLTIGNARDPFNRAASDIYKAQ